MESSSGSGKLSAPARAWARSTHARLSTWHRVSANRTTPAIAGSFFGQFLSRIAASGAVRSSSTSKGYIGAELAASLASVLFGPSIPARDGAPLVTLNVATTAAIQIWKDRAGALAMAADPGHT